MEIYWKKIKKPLKKNKLFNLLTTPYYAPATPTPFLLGGGGWTFRGGVLGDCNFSTKNKLKSGMFNDKKFINKNSLFCRN